MSNFPISKFPYYTRKTVGIPTCRKVLLISEHKQFVENKTELLNHLTKDYQIKWYLIILKFYLLFGRRKKVPEAEYNKIILQPKIVLSNSIYNYFLNVWWNICSLRKGQPNSHLLIYFPPSSHMISAFSHLR